MRYTAIMTNQERNAHWHKTDEDYKTKKDFTHDIRANGYRVTAILTDAEIEHIKKERWQAGTKYSDLIIDYVMQCL